jgi:hypothetical protein
MKNSLFTVLILLFSFILFGQNNPSSVYDYYLLLPDKYIWTHPKSVKERSDLISVKDLKNGYLKLENTLWEGWGDIALFTKSDKKNLIAISMTGCGPVCAQEINILEYKENNWRNVTNTVFPKCATAFLHEQYIKFFKKDYENKDIPILYVLPRYGTSIEVITQGVATEGRTVKLATIKFINDKFVLFSE